MLSIFRIPDQFPFAVRICELHIILNKISTLGAMCRAGRVLTHCMKCGISDNISLQGDSSFKPLMILHLPLIFFQKSEVCFDKTFSHGSTNRMVIVLRTDSAQVASG